MLHRAADDGQLCDSFTKHYYTNGQRIATRVNGEVYYLHSDHLGSTTLVTNDTGDEVGRVQYDPYGNLIENTLPAGLTDRLFTGQRWDSDLNLYDYRARFYDPLTGSFTQPDSIVPNPMDPRAWNRMGYVYGNPVNLTDPSGHCPLCVVAIGASVFATGGAIHYTATHPGGSFDRTEYLSTVFNWAVWGAAAGATAYMAPGLVGYGLSMAGTDAIGTAVWLNRLGVPVARLYGLMNAGQSAWDVGYFLQLAGWVGVRGLVGLGKPYGGRSPEGFRRLIERHPRGSFEINEGLLNTADRSQGRPLGSTRAGTLKPHPLDTGTIRIVVRPDYNYADVGHEYAHFRQYLDNRPLSDVEAWRWEFTSSVEVGDYQWFRLAWRQLLKYSQYE